MSSNFDFFMNVKPFFLVIPDDSVITEGFGDPLCTGGVCVCVCVCVLNTVYK